MFTGIVRAQGRVVHVTKNAYSTTFFIRSLLASSLRVDESIAHNGVCLTIESTEDLQYQVTAVAETLKKTTLGSWETNRIVNLEQSVRLQDRLDGHLVQGHIDTVGLCKNIYKSGDDVRITFSYPKQFAPLLIEKGSVAVDGISLTVYDLDSESFTVAVIPYTLQHTSLGQLKEGEQVNLEFDMLGKYIERHLQLSKH